MLILRNNLLTKIFVIKLIMHSIRLFYVFVSLLFLNSCTSTPEEFMHMSEYKLCISVLSKPGNIHNENKLIAIERLKYNCEPYRAEAEEIKKQRDELIDAIATCTVLDCTD